MAHYSPSAILSLFLLSVGLASPGAAQGRPDIAWMRGGHLITVQDVAYSPDGQLIASTGVDGTLKIWRASDHRLLRTEQAHQYPLSAGSVEIAWSRDGRYVATGATDVKLWEVDRSNGVELIHKWTVPWPEQFGISGLSFSYDTAPNQRLAIAGARTGAVVRVSDGGSIPFFVAGDGWGVAEFSPSGLLATNRGPADIFSSLILLDASTGQVVHSYGSGTVSDSAAFSATGTELAAISATSGKRVRVYQAVANWGILFEHFEPSGPDAFRGVDVAFSPDGRRLVAGGHNLELADNFSQVRLWDVAAQSKIRTVSVRGAGHPTVAFSPDSTQFVSGNAFLQLWRADDGFELADISAHASPLHALSMAPNGQLLFSAGSNPNHDGTIRAWRATDGELHYSVTSIGAVPAAAISPDGLQLLAAAFKFDGTWIPSLELFDVPTGARIWSVPAVGVINQSAVAFLPDGQTFLTTTSSAIEVRSTVDGSLLRQITVGGAQQLTIADDQHFVARSGTAVDLRRLSDGAVVKGFNFSGEVASAFVLSNDGQTIATAVRTNAAQFKVHIWSMDGTWLRTLSGHTSSIDALAFSPTGEWLVSAGRAPDGTLRVWETSSGLQLRVDDKETNAELIGQFSVASLAFSPDGRKLAYGRGDGTVVMTDFPFTPVVTRETPTIVWPEPGVLAFGTPLDGTQLNATANVPGTFAYDPPAGTVLGVGTHTLSTTFTPDDQIAYTTATASVSITVRDLTPPVIAGTPDDFTVPASGPGGAVASYPTPTATDLVDGAVPVTCTPASGSAFQVGTTTVTCSATDLSANTATTTFQITVSPFATTTTLDARAIWRWHQSQWPSRHLAIFPDGTILAQTWNNVTLPVLDPSTGGAALFPGGFPQGSSGVAPNPVIWADGAAAYLVGAWGGPTSYRQDGVFQWRWDNEFGCCNNMGVPYLTIDRGGRRLLASLGFRLYSLPLDTGTPAIFTQGGEAIGMVTATRQTAYVAGMTRHVTKWSVSGPQPVFEWSRQLSTPLDTWNFSEGAIGADGSFVVTRSGNHASPFWAGGDIWRAGDLHWISADGQSTWAAAARASTPPVIGRSGLIYVGGPASGAPQAQLNGAGIVRAFNQQGQMVWSVVTTGLPQDLLVGDDGNVYVVTGGTSEGTILALDHETGAVELLIEHVPAPWEILLRNGVIYVTGDAGISAIPLPDGFAVNYDPQAPWPVRQHDNQRTSLGGDQTAPVLTLPENLTIEAISAAGAVVTFEASALDDVDGSVPASCAPASGETFSIGSTTVTCSATDTAGNRAEGSFVVTVIDAPTTLTARSATGTYGGSTALIGLLDTSRGPVAGVTLEFTLQGLAVGSAVTDHTGRAMLADVSLAGLTVGTYAGAIGIRFNGAPGLAASAGLADLVVGKATPVIAWPTPAEVIEGTVLGAAQLNASTTVPGSFSYSPGAGTVLLAGSRLLKAAFTPSDSVNYDSVITSVTILVAPPIVVAIGAPNGGERLFVNTRYDVSWTATGGVGGPTSIDVEYSTNSGASFTSIADCRGLPGAATSCPWLVPNLPTSRGRVRVIARDTSGNVKSMASAADFTISTLNAFVAVLEPTGATTWVIGAEELIQWSHNLGAAALFKIEYRSGGGDWVTIADAVPSAGPGSGSFVWRVTATATTSAEIQVQWTQAAVSGTSSAFVVQTPTIAFLEPGPGVSWRIGTTKKIKWEHTIPPGVLQILEISRDGGETWAPLLDALGLPIVVEATGTKHTIDWTVSGPETGDNRAMIRIRVPHYGDLVFSSSSFTIR